ncbi:MAG: hypothetical protein C0614_06175 [Desulfuromonas sp.]|nr:MAG: hypothetical protein C0614_06175 [Desulfuromonas sp.]
MYSREMPMAQTSSVNFVRALSLALLMTLIAGCASLQGRTVFEEGEVFEAEGNYPKAVGKYYEATQLAPDNQIFKLKLLSVRTRAAGFHLTKARVLVKEGKVDEALDHYRRARGFDPTLELASREEQELLDKRQSQELAEEAESLSQQKRLSLARKALNKALELDPNNATALLVQKMIDKGPSSVSMDGFELDVSSSEPITLRFKDANIKEVFGILTKLTGINFIFDSDIREQGVSVLLERASLAEALELILQMNGLSKKVLNEKTLIIYPQTREKEKQYEDQIIQTFYLSHIDAKKAVNLLRTMLQLRKIYVHEERNALVIRDRPDVIRLAEQILDAADRENSEVLFSLELIAVQNTDDLSFGPTLSSYSVSGGFANPSTGDEAVGALVASTLGSGTNVVNLVSNASELRALYTLPTATFDLAKTLTDTETLASPKIRVRNKEKAKVHIGTREPVITVTTTGDTSTDNIQYVDVGVKVDVEPNIQLDNTVETKLTLEVSQVIDRFQTNNGSVALTISTTNAQTTLTLKDGVQTILGGLFEKQATSSVNTLPLLGDLPLIGKLFSGISDKDTKREILLSITPYILKQVVVPELDVATIWSGGEDNLKAGPNFGAFARPLVSEVLETRPAAAPAMAKENVMPQISGPESVEEAIGEVLGEPSSQTYTPPEEWAESLPAQEVSPQVVKQQPEVAVPVRQPPPVTEPMETLPGPVEVAGAETPFVSEQVSQSQPEPVLLPGPTQLEMPDKGPAKLAISGPQMVDVNNDFYVSVEIRNVDRLYSAPLFVSYDPDLLELTAISEGSFLKKSGKNTVFSSSPNRTTGQVIVGYKQGAGATGESGSGVLLSLGFQAKASGNAEVSLNRVNFRDPDGSRLTVEPASTVIEIR